MRHLPFILLLIAIVAGGYYSYRHQESDGPHFGFMYCQTARSCARYIEAQFKPPTGQNVTARADGDRLIYEYRLDYDRDAFEAGGSLFEDGSTVQDFDDNLRANACSELYHRDFLSLGGAVIHQYIYTDGETAARIVIEGCADARD